MRFSIQSDLSHQLDDEIGEADKFQAWKYGISMVLEENELDTYISGEVPVPEGDEVKALHKKNLVKAKRIIIDSSTLYHKYLPLRHLRICLIPQPSYLKKII